MSVQIWKALPLSEYLSLTGEANEKENEENQQEQADADANILQFVSDRNQEKGKNILMALRESKDLSWTSEGDVLYKGGLLLLLPLNSQHPLPLY